ncbi:MAG TPA: glycosyltransferase family 2 protein [Ktedonobacterales bacterium]
MEFPHIIGWVVLAAEIALALPIAYLCLLALSAILTARRRRVSAGALASGEREHTTASAEPRFAVLIPAHNEEGMIGTLLASLAELRYPRDRYTVYVIADNCTDRTAAIAEQTGWAKALVRTDPTRRGKGYALSWAFQRLHDQRPHYDAYVVLDADSVVVPGFLDAFAAEFMRGATAMQACNTVLNTIESPSTALRWLALTLMNHVRPLGRSGLGASSTLTGNGMCLSYELLERFPWEAFGVAEDYQYYLTLVLRGQRVRYVPEALVRSHMPTSFTQLQTQDIRWESGAPETSTTRTGLRLIARGLRARDIVRLDAAAELFTPPLSLLMGSVAATFVAALVVSLLLRSPLHITLAALLALGLAGYCASAFAMLRPPRAVYTALLYAPGYMAWKLWVQVVLRRSKKYAGKWTRTTRPAEVK